VLNVAMAPTPLPPAALTAPSLRVAVAELAGRDPALAAIVDRFGPPPLWARPAGFGTLVQVILEQQVSLDSARAAYDRLRTTVEPVAPVGFLELDDAALLAIGFSRQKARYARALATALVDGSLDLDALGAMDDDAARAALVALPGIGPWTATIYLLMVLGRPDVWPITDIALAQAAGEALDLERRPSPDELLTIGERWRPWRSVAARLLWHDYLGRRGRA
jgi:DNA-3-methyladenine glycosylase II